MTSFLVKFWRHTLYSYEISECIIKSCNFDSEYDNTETKDRNKMVCDNILLF